MPGKTQSRDRAVPAQVRDMLLHLYQVQSAVAVCVAALRQQNCELDTDISNVLQRCVADRTLDQIERLEELGKLPKRS